MFDMNELLSNKNQRLALAHLENKKDGCGKDGIRITEFKEYWEMNHQRIEGELRNGTYEPGVIMTYEIVNGYGKHRNVSSMNVTDRLITRMLAQKLKRYIEPIFLEKSYAYQDNKGILQAVMQAKAYAENGNEIVIEIDLKNYFDNIPLEKMYELICQKIVDERVRSLIYKYLFCKVEIDESIVKKTIGLVQGNSISPILSNWYLHELDEYMESCQWNWIRFADNIYVLVSNKEAAVQIFKELTEKLNNEFEIPINDKKSGIHQIYENTMLGYYFIKVKDGIDIRKKQYTKNEVYVNWNRCSVEKVNREYHIVQDGIISKKDYALLFENEDERHHIPVEIVHNMNMYGNVTISSNVLGMLGWKKIAVSFFDKYGNLMGHYVPERYGYYSAALLNQCELYVDKERRLQLAKAMEIAGLHNMRSNLRYYQKKNGKLSQEIMQLSERITAINEGKSVDELLLIEARARQLYYSAFNQIISNKGYEFVNRTKRPPKDEINAMISFGNTLLYNQFLQIIWKTSLDPRIGVIHATNRRSHSLNLDFADIFKPVITDRVIFSLINFRQIQKDKHFEGNKNDGIYLNKQGKRIFIREFMEKLNTKIVIRNESITYHQLMVNEVRDFQKCVLEGDKYKPYKYY